MTRIDGNDYDHLSALSTMNIEHFYSKWTKTLSVRGENDLLPKAFVSKLENRIHFGAAVHAFSQNSEKVTVSFRQGNLQQQLEADRVVVTIPFSVLRTIDLGSSVSVQKREAINRLKYESVLRVYVQSKTRFWNQQGIRGDSGTDLPIGIIVDHTSRQPGTRGILEAQMAYQLAETAKKMNRADLVPWTVGEMNKVHPGIVENYEGAVTVSWDDDPYSRGAWAYYAPGDMTNIYPHVATAEGRIHFAGEHTSYLPSTIEGAIHSGIRAAHEINAM
jgi:monoamine oxidase